MRPFPFALLIVVLMGIFLPDAAYAEEGERPKIGLALSGGGARGGAHIGVLRALEELDVPIDYIAGTSMGAIIGAMYSAGYSPDQIEEIVTKTNWVDAFSDQSDRRGLTMRKKELDSDFLIPHRVGFNDGVIQLPLGVLEGQKLDQIFQKVFLRVKDIRHFDDLPIPFRAVATNLVTGSEVVIDEGSLADAVRASMSIPGVFAPVVIDDLMLVDGGMANNLPVSVARDMGADIVIAVDISSPLLTRKQLDSVLTVTEQLTNFLTRKNTEAQIASLGPKDVLLVPDLKDFGSSDFENVLKIVPAGYEAVMISQTAVVQYASNEEWQRASVPGAAESDPEFIIQFVEITNESGLNDEIIRSRLDVELGEPLDFARLNTSINQIYSIDVFQTVTYDLVQNEAGETGLEVIAIPRNWGPNYLQFGLEFSDDFSGNSDFGIGAAYTRNALNSLAGELRVDVEIGREGLFEIDFYQPVDKQARWFTETRAFWTREIFNVFDQEDYLAQVEIKGPGAALGFGRNFSTTELLRLDYEYYRGKAGVLIGDTDIVTDNKVDIGELVLQYRHDSLDNLWFPGDGSLYALAYRYASEELGAASDYQQAYFGGQIAFSWGKNHLQTGLQLGYSFNDKAPLERWYELGGFGRLSGLAPDQLVGRQLAFANLALYRRLNDINVFPVYAGFTLEAGNVWRFRDEVSFDSLRYSASVFLGANTPIGPIYLAYGYSDNDQNAFYFYLGNPWKTSRY